MAEIRHDLRLSLRAAARLLGTDHGNLLRAEQHSERHLNYALDMIARYRMAAGKKPMRAPRVEVDVARDLVPVIDKVREVHRAPRRESAASAVSGGGGAIHDTGDPSVLEAGFEGAHVTIDLDRPVASITFQGKLPRWREAPTGMSEDEFYRLVVTAATNNPTPIDP